MRKLFSISVVLMLISVVIALAQAPSMPSREERQKLTMPPHCTTSDKAFYGPGAITHHNGMSFRCAHVYDEWMTETSRVSVGEGTERPRPASAIRANDAPPRRLA